MKPASAWIAVPGVAIFIERICEGALELVEPRVALIEAVGKSWRGLGYAQRAELEGL